MQNTTSDFLEILRTLSEYKVDFIVVGGVCAVLHGAPMTAFDLDVVHSRSADNYPIQKGLLINYIHEGLIPIKHQYIYKSKALGHVLFMTQPIN